MTEAPAAIEHPAARAEVEFLVRFMRAAHEAGYPTADLEERVLDLGSRLGVASVQVSATPTLVELSVGSLAAQQTFALRVRPTTVDLDAIDRLDDLAEHVLDQGFDPATALSALTDITSKRRDRPWPVMLGAYSLSGAALTPVLGGGWREGIAGAVVGAFAGAVALPATRAARTEPLVGPLAAIAASLGAAAVAQLGLQASPDVVTLAAIVTFLPGMTLTIGMRELATEHLQSGVANTASALVQLVGVVFGVAIGNSVATTWFGHTPTPAPDTAFTGVHVVAAGAAGLAFTATLRAPLRTAPLMSAAAVLALVANAVGAGIFGAEAGVFIAALVVGVTGGLSGFVLRRSPLVFIVPGILMLVPGSVGFHSVLQLVSGETANGVEAGVNMFVTAMSIAYGLMISSVILPHRLTKFTRGDL